jgi:hypothetical protein
VPSRNGGFRRVGDMAYGGVWSSVRMADGRVLVIHNAIDPAEIFDPASGTFSWVPNLLAPGGSWAIGLRDSRVLVLDDNGTGAHVLDVSAGTLTAVGSRKQRHDNGGVTMLADGRILLTGGVDDSGRHYLATAEIFSPTTGLFTSTGTMKTARENHVAALLSDGRVLIAGGDQGDSGDEAKVLSSAEIYDPGTGQFSPAANLTAARSLAMAAILPDHRVLVAGGEGGLDVNLARLQTAEVFAPETGTFSQTGSMTTVRIDAAIAVMGDGRVLLAGGSDADGNVLGTAEIYDPASGVFRQTSSMTQPRNGPNACLLADGSVLISGGWDQADTLSSAELYWP